jgi:hypothetical protein
MPNIRRVKPLRQGTSIQVVHETFNHDNSAGTTAGYTTEVYSATPVTEKTSGETAIIFTPTNRTKQAVYVPAEKVNSITVFRRNFPGLRTVFQYHP